MRNTLKKISYLSALLIFGNASALDNSSLPQSSGDSSETARQSQVNRQTALAKEAARGLLKNIDKDNPEDRRILGLYLKNLLSEDFLTRGFRTTVVAEVLKAFDPKNSDEESSSESQIAAPDAEPQAAKFVVLSPSEPVPPEYNIEGSLTGIGVALLPEIIREMSTDPKTTINDLKAFAGINKTALEAFGTGNGSGWYLQRGEICANLMHTKTHGFTFAPEEGRKIFREIFCKEKADGSEGAAAEAFFNTYSLYDACEKGYFEAIKYFIEKRGANISDVLDYLSWHLNSEFVKYFIEERGVDVNVRFNRYDEDGGTILMHAARSGSLEAVKYLIEEKGADINARDHYGCTVLAYATQSRSLDVVKYLVEEKGADVNAMVYSSWADREFSILTYAKSFSRRSAEITEYLKSKGAVETPGVTFSFF